MRQAVLAGTMKMTMAIVAVGLLALVGSSTASLDALNSVKESQELENTGGPSCSFPSIARGAAVQNSAFLNRVKL